jgi:uncharacterized SAM-binding protein YcdF (DUF218 family)
VDKKILQAAKILWDYLKLDQPMRKCDCVFALGSHDLRVADFAADLINKNWAPLLVCSGGLGRLTREIWQESEAAKFAEIAQAAGVRKEQIIIEDQSTNTGENILYTKKLLEDRDYCIKSAILVHKPYMERRALATVQRYWPELEVVISSPRINFKEYATDEIPLAELIQIMAGDFQRILIYPEKGFQTKQGVTPEAVQAFEYLRRHGFSKYLIEG